MSLAFRNLNIDPSEPVAHWPTEAVQAALERGDLADWHRLAAEIVRQPWGRTARQVEEVLSYSRPFGVAEAMETMIARARKRLPGVRGNTSISIEIDPGQGAAHSRETGSGAR